MNLHALALHVVGAIGSLYEIGDIEVYHIPPLLKPQRHRRYERFHFRSCLIAGAPDAPSYFLIVQYLHLKGKMPFEVFDDKDNVRIPYP